MQRRGDPRQTRDGDLTQLTGLAGEEADARRFALERRVLLVETCDGVPLDISLN